MNSRRKYWSCQSKCFRPICRKGVLSLPLRLSISAVIIALALPICTNCINFELQEVSRRTAIMVGELIADTASELSNRPFGESRRLQIEDRAQLFASGTRIVVGGAGNDTCSLIRCIGNGGWAEIIEVELGTKFNGICSRNLTSFVIDESSGDIVMRSEKIEGQYLLILEEV